MQHLIFFPFTFSSCFIVVLRRHLRGCLRLSLALLLLTSAAYGQVPTFGETTQLFPQFASGAGWTTYITVHNSTQQVDSGRVVSAAGVLPADAVHCSEFQPLFLRRTVAKANPYSCRYSETGGTFEPGIHPCSGSGQDGKALWGYESVPVTRAANSRKVVNCRY